MKLNNKGFTAIETIISIVLLSIVIIMIAGFKNNILKSELFVNDYIVTQSAVDNNLTKIYNEWITEDYYVTVKSNRINVEIVELEISEHNTEALEVNFKGEGEGGIDRTYILERSVYHDE